MPKTIAGNNAINFFVGIKQGKLNPGSKTYAQICKE
jgi:hypothetical protein